MIALQSMKTLAGILKKDGMYNIYFETEIRSIFCIAKIELNGIGYDLLKFLLYNIYGHI